MGLSNYWTALFLDFFGKQYVQFTHRNCRNLFEKARLIDYLYKYERNNPADTYRGESPL